MIRRLFTILSALSLVLCVAACVLWVRSYWVADQLRSWAGRAWSPAEQVWLSATVNLGRLDLTRYDATYSGSLPPELRATSAGPPPPQVRRSSFPAYDSSRGRDPGFLGFYYGDVTSDRTRPPGVRCVERWRSVRLPLWAAAAALAAPPAVWLRHRRRRGRVLRRLARGLCPACGYDLRPTPEQGKALLDRCPECGAVSVNTHRRTPIAEHLSVNTNG